MPDHECPVTPVDEGNGVVTCSFPGCGNQYMYEQGQLVPLEDVMSGVNGDD